MIDCKILDNNFKGTGYVVINPNTTRPYALVVKNFNIEEIFKSKEFISLDYLLESFFNILKVQKQKTVYLDTNNLCITNYVLYFQKLFAPKDFCGIIEICDSFGQNIKILN